MNYLRLLLISFLLASNFVFAQDLSQLKVQYVTLEKGEASPLKELAVEVKDQKVKWGHEITLYPEIEYQVIEGIGGAFNEIGGEALLSLSKTQQDVVIDQLFASDKAGFTFCRTAIGSSDFGLDAYSYSNKDGDYKMKEFSIERDQKYVLPYLKAAFKINPNLTLFASPWSPPAWMKINNSITGLTEQENALKADKKIYEAYARYFAKYLQEYQNEGIFIDRMCVQNENDANTKYPSCVMSPSQMLELTTDHILPLFKKEKISTKVYAGTFRTAEKLDLIELLTLEKVDQFEGVGIQYTSPFIITDAIKMKPQLKMFHTEGHCYNGKNSTDEAKHRLEEVAQYINSGVSNFCYWNMILNETTESGWEWPQNSLINIDREKKTIQYNPDYNAMYIISHFIKPGDVRIASNSQKPMITVKDKDGNIKILIQNTDNNDSTFRIHLQGETKKITLPKQSITAIVI
ncbi:glycoside hydrolase family 30 protein [Flammeovirga agarivorans]|uniref:Glycosyl hydrolase family 30 TIM-barrel domain-containing protein n=1 Tax=Flammeovirga agarivorans TaxID=2726742 RepID=A0A7X8XU70_9BACT|nr:glycoside hydrolase family 30 beta sandwich domain-containing protein [Flammeovirga agarivorans]NLR89810.1 hypothetical protein [Flammeovirga agarivorans]